MSSPLIRVLIAGVALAGSPPVRAQFLVELKPQTREAFDHYVRSAELFFSTRWRGERSFLWVEENRPALERVLAGEVAVERGRTAIKPEAPQGMIHHWVAAAFIPGASSADVAALLVDFARHKTVFRDVRDSRLLSRQGHTVSGYQRITRKKILAVVLDTDLKATLVQPSPTRAYLVSATTRVQEVEDAGNAQTTLYPPGRGHGFLWSIYANWRVQDTPRGVLVECESVTLSRDIPLVLSRIIRPLVEDVPREALQAMLEDVRRALRR